MVTALMIAISALFVWGCLFLGFKLDQFGKALENYGTRAFDQERAFRAMERAENLNAEKVDGMMAHFTLPPVVDPLPLPPVESEPTQTGKKGRKKDTCAHLIAIAGRCRCEPGCICKTTPGHCGK